MLNERLALKIRLEQLDNAELRIIQELREERAQIFARLRELDQQQHIMSLNHDSTKQMKFQTSDDEHVNVLTKQIRPRRNRPSRRSKTRQMREVAIELLKNNNAPLRAKDLQMKIEEETGLQIANMTTFMKAVEKVDQRVVKSGRGLYAFVESQQSFHSL